MGGRNTRELTEIRPCITPRSLRRLYRVLIPGPLTNVMEEPAVELPLLTGHGPSTSLGCRDGPQERKNL